MLAMPSLKHSFAAELAGAAALLLDTLVSPSLDIGVTSEGPRDSLEPCSGDGPLELSSHATSAIPRASAAVAAENFLKFICFSSHLYRKFSIKFNNLFALNSLFVYF
jgi:hypothetical protein